MISEGEAEDCEPERLRFTVQVNFKHPTISAAEITAALEREPEITWTVGEPRTTPTGNPLRGRWKETYWTYSNRFEGERAFFREVMTTLSDLFSKRDVIKALVQSGGEATLLIGLPGDKNIGDVLTPDQLKQIGEAGFHLSVEVFPKMD
jgi:hypothetical protein